MAAIASNTDVNLANVRMLWSNTSSWVGGVVPGILDDVTIQGTRTTINQSAISYWTTNTVTITVASTLGFPSSNSWFYTRTDRGDALKINYVSTTGTTFANCSVDQSDLQYQWARGQYNLNPIQVPLGNFVLGTIPNGAYVHSPSPWITIPAGYQANVLTMTVQNGGIINMEPGSNLGANSYITVRDGRFLGTANVGNISSIMINRLEASGVGYFQCENYEMSFVNIDGGETRSYATLNANTSINSTSLFVNPVQGSFAAGDEIAVYDTTTANNKKFLVNTPYTSDITQDWRGMDEGLDVISVQNNQIWVARRNGARGKIKTTRISGANTILTVDKNDFLGQLNFKANDIIVIANNTYTIQTVVDSEYVLGAYNFQTGSTLTDFLLDYANNSSWSIDSNGAYANNTAYNVLVNKNLWRREMIVETEMSPWSGYNSGSGTRGTDQFGLVYGYDPAFRAGNRSGNDYYQTGWWKVNKESDNTMQMNSKYSTAGDWMDVSRDQPYVGMITTGYITNNLLGSASLTSSTTPTSGTVDDGYWSLTLPWASGYNFGANNYTTFYVGTNSYLTFNAGSTVYSGVSPTNPALDKILITAADNSCQRIYYGTEGTAPNRTYRVRYEGTAKNSGTLGNPNLLWESVFYENNPNRLDIQFGQNSRWPMANGYSGIFTINGLIGGFLAQGNGMANTGVQLTSANTSFTTTPYRALVQSPATYRTEIRNGFIKYSINGEQVGERFDSSGSVRGLFGVYAWNNASTRVKSITYKAPTQDLYITTANTFTVGDTVYESGTEIFHNQGRRILKIASKVTSPGTHDDLAFNYRGSYDANTWPIPIYGNGSASNYIWHLGNHDFSGGPDYYADWGTAANSYVIIDMTKQRTFTHVAYTPRVDDTGNAAGTFIKGVRIQGSNDNITFTDIYGPQDDTKRFCNPQGDAYTWYNQMATYYVGSQTYRYLKFIVNGNNGSVNSTLNRMMKLGVFNFASNNYTIQLNNVSDFSNNDIITVMAHSTYTCNDDYHHYQAVKLGQNPDNYFWTSNTHSTIINIDAANNTLYLDRPINYGFVEGGESVVKINRNFRMLGWLDPVGGKFQKPAFYMIGGTQTPQIRYLKNMYFYNVGSSRVVGSSWRRGVDFGCEDYYNPAMLDGVSVEGFNNTDANGVTSYYGIGICRNGFVGNVRDYRPYYTQSSSGVATMNMKISNVYRFRPEDPKNKINNYNEVAGVYNIQASVSSNVDQMDSPVQNELRRNNFHGIYNINAFAAGSTTAVGDNQGIVYQNEYNRVYGCNNNPFNNGTYPVSSWPVGLDLHAEHPGIRLSQYRNEGYLSWQNSIIDWSMPLGGIKDFMRTGFDVETVSAYNVAKQIPGTDYMRQYHLVNSSSYPKQQFAVWCKQAVPFQIYIEFQYRFPMRLNRVQSATANYSKLILNCVQNGIPITGYPIYLPMPTTDEWQTFSTTISTIPAAVGRTGVLLSCQAGMTFVDIRNSRGMLLTDNPSSISVIGNTFDLNKYFSTGFENKYTSPLTTRPNILKGVKF